MTQEKVKCFTKINVFTREEVATQKGRQNMQMILKGLGRQTGREGREHRDNIHWVEGRQLDSGATHSGKGQTIPKAANTRGQEVCLK